MSSVDPEPQKLEQSFFARPAHEVARDLLGTLMVRQVAGIDRRARIIETEAYMGPQDLAAHSSKGRTARTEVMFGPPGRAYVYLIYGMYQMLNVVVGQPGQAQAVLLRAAEPQDGWAVELTGPGRLARAFAIQRADNGRDITGDDLHFLGRDRYEPKVQRTRRINIDYAGHWKNRLLRFVDVRSALGQKLVGKAKPARLV